MRCEKYYSNVAFIVKFCNLSVWVSWLLVVSLPVFGIHLAGCLGFIVANCII